MYTLRSCLAGIIGAILIFVGLGFLQRPFSQGGGYLLIPGIAFIALGVIIMFKKGNE